MVVYCTTLNCICRNSFLSSGPACTIIWPGLSFDYKLRGWRIHVLTVTVANRSWKWQRFDTMKVLALFEMTVN